jgi:hypothetical protein
MCVTVTVVTGHSVALSRRSHLFSTMSSLHDVLVHDNFYVLGARMKHRILGDFSRKLIVAKDG